MNGAYDFKGNLLHSVRQLAQEYKQTIDWSSPVPLEPAVYVNRMSYDALNRPAALETPDESVVRPFYNEANLLERVEVHLRGASDATPFVTNIGYDAKSQRTRIDYGTADGEGISTTYLYDPETFRLTGLVTRRNGSGFDGTDRPGEVQSLHYTYDPTGNVTHIRDDAQQTVYFLNRRVEPSTDYTYDALYRLIEARGREHLGQTAGTPDPPTAPDAFNGFHTGLLHPGDGNAMGVYFESYVYDAVGNILSLQHRGSDPASPGWTRAYAYNEVSQLEAGKMSNRLTGTAVGAVAETYHYDGPAGLHGNITSMPHLPLIQWDYRDQIQATARQVVGGGVPETTWYVYDAGGRRVRKVTERAGTATRLKERIYIGRFEIYREYAGDGATVDLERETLHVMDDQRRIALVETRTDVPASQPLIRYQLGNHLGSASLELDDQAQIISYEEHYPYGSTSYQAVRSQSEAPKRYRYTGKERDEETGLADHGARYYAPWLGRWANCDPEGLKDGLNPYLYVHANPVLFIDADGKEAKNPLWFKEVVPAILRAAKKEGIPVKNAMLLIIWAYAEQAPIGPGGKPYIPSEHKNRLFNAQPTMKPRSADKKEPLKEVDRLCPGYETASCQVSTIKGKAQATIYNLVQLMDVTTGRQAPSPHFGFSDVYSGVVFTLQRIAGDKIHADVAPPSYGSIDRLLRAPGTTTAQFFDKHLDKWAFSGYAKKIIDDKIPETATRETKAYVLATIPKLEAKIKEITGKLAEVEKTIAEAQAFIVKAKAEGMDISDLEGKVKKLEEHKAEMSSEKAGFEEHLKNFQEFKSAMGW